MACLKNIVLIALVVVVTVAFVQQAHGANLDLEDVALRIASWKSCNLTTTPMLSCDDCNTRLVCKGVAGLLISCLNPYRPYCVNGVCSPVPSAECGAE